MFEIRDYGNAFNLVHNNAFVDIIGKCKLKQSVQNIYYTSINSLLDSFLHEFLDVSCTYRLRLSRKNYYEVYFINFDLEAIPIDLDSMKLASNPVPVYSLTKIFNKLYKKYEPSILYTRLIN